MANVAVNPQTAPLNGVATLPAGASVGTADTGFITANAVVANHTGKDQVEMRNLVLRFTAAGAGTVTILAGANPPSNRAASGNLVLATINGAVIASLEAANYTQADGTVQFTVQTAAVTVNALRCAA